MVKPFFSVIITTYNRALVLPGVIESVLKQTFNDIEIIIVDDCSADNTMQLIKLYDDAKVKYYSTATNSGGPALPRNVGIKNANGKWLSFCDSDDYFRETHLEKIYNFILNGKIAEGIISTNAFIIRDGVKTSQLFFNNYKANNNEISFRQNWNSNHAIFSSICITNNNLKSFRDAKEYQSIEDYLFLLDNMWNGKKHYMLSSVGIFYSDASLDSIRSLLNNGDCVYRYKLLVYKQYKLWKSKYALPFLSIICRDFCKMHLRKLVKQ